MHRNQSVTYNSAARGGGLIFPWTQLSKMKWNEPSNTLTHPLPAFFNSTFSGFDRAHPILTSHTLYIHSQHLALNVLSTFWLIELNCSKELYEVPRSESRFLLVIGGTICYGTKVKPFYRPTVPSLSFRSFHSFHFGIVIKMTAMSQSKVEQHISQIFIVIPFSLLSVIKGGHKEVCSFLHLFIWGIPAFVRLF